MDAYTERKIDMEINKYITYLTFVPWIFIYIVSVVRNLNNKQYQRFSWNYFKKNIFRIFRIDTLFLIIVFFYFASFGMEFVNKYLFAVICLYLCVNSFYEKNKSLEKNFGQKYLAELILLFIFMLIPFGLYYIKHDLAFTYKFMLISLFLEYILILLVSTIVKLFKKIIKKSNYSF